MPHPGGNPPGDIFKDTMLKTILPLMALAGCAAPHAYIGVQNVTPLAQVQDSRFPDHGSAYLNLLFPLGGGFSAQVEPILTFEGAWVLRLACDYELPLPKLHR